MQDDQSPLRGLKKPAEYRAARAHIFPSDLSLHWFMRTRRAGLVQAGAMLKVGGRIFVDERAFDAAVLELGQRDIAEQAA